MIIYINANGDVIEQEYTNIVQGDNNANEIYLIAPLPANAQPTINFTLPNGFVTEPYQMTRTFELSVGDELNVWKKSIVDVPITEYYGLVKAQIKIVVNSSTIAVARVKFKIDEGNDWQLPQEPTETVYTDILNALSAIAGDVLNKVDIDYTNDGQTVEQQIINNANGLKFVKTVNDETTTVEIKEDGLYVDDVKLLDNTEVQNLFAQTAGRKYPVGSTTGTGEVFNDYTNNVASGDYSHAEGYHTTASNRFSHAEGNYSVASGDFGSHAEGSYTLASANYAHAEGSDTIASGACSHAEGSNTIASGGSSHTEGMSTIASGRWSHAGGAVSRAFNDYSFAHGESVSTSAKHQAVFGAYNIDDEDALFIVGNGELVDNESIKSNAFVVKADGTIYGGDDKELSTKEYVNSVANAKQNVIDSSHKLSADLVDDTNATNKFVTASEKSQITTNSGNITNLQNNKVDKKPDGTSDLIYNNKITTVYLPDFLLGQVLYGGNVTTGAVATLTINAKSKLGTANNTITLTNDTTAITGYEANDGIYYIATADFTFAGLAILTGDWLISRGNAWDKIDNTDAVTGIKGNAENSYRIGNVEITPDNLDDTTTTNKFVTASEKAQIATNTTNIANKLDKESEFSIQYSPDSFHLNNATETNTFLSNDSGIKITNEIVYTGGAPKAEIYLHDGFIDIISNGRAGNTSGNVRIDGNYVETQNNRVTSLSSSSTDTEYPTAKCVYDAINSAITTTLNTPV